MAASLDFLKGKVGVWIHDIGSCYAGNLDAINVALHQVGVGVVILKATDGGRWYPQNTDKGAASFSYLCNWFQERGYVVLAWGYHYLGEPGQTYTANGQRYASTLGYKAETELAIEAIQYRPNKAAFPNYRGPDGYVVDVEDEAAGKVAEAAYTANAIRTAVGDFPLGYAPIGVPRYHASDPYRQFDDVFDFCLPQCYDTFFGRGDDWSLQMFGLDSITYDLKLPWYPIYADCPPGQAESDTSLQTWHQSARGYQIDFVSLWVLDTATPDVLDRLGRVCEWWNVAPVPTPKPPPPAFDWEAQYDLLRSTIEAELVHLDDTLKISAKQIAEVFSHEPTTEPASDPGAGDGAPGDPIPSPPAPGPDGGGDSEPGATPAASVAADS